MEFVQRHYDYYLFTKNIGAKLVTVLVYVDDMLITSSNLHLIRHVRKELQERFKMKNLGELKYFLGIEFSRSHKGRKPVCTPLEFNHKLTSVEFDQEVNTNVSENIILEDKGSYQRLIGRLLYLTMTRPGIAFVVQMLSQYMHAPKASHMDAARRVERYIKSTPGLGLFMPTGSCKNLVAYCDSDWGAYVESKR
uniref:Uncharacterized mitochondrial protein AtMg00810-like n=1 Tax=Nicotiana tabacum TaxID=4097 RepID=A0A1S4CD58_TOBAC|nr:PREDICTED: uncharacterized mitochondrial protein AtMg00810-like [Nicotiana tabacum]